MTPRLIIRHSGASYSIYMDEDDGTQSVIATDIRYQHLLTEEDLDDIHWYIEEYPDAPFGAYRGRARRTIERLGAIGDTIAELVLCKDDAGNRLKNVLADDRLQIWVESISPEVLSLPWELFALPRADSRLRLANVVRTCYPSNANRNGAFSTLAHTQKTATRILFIISRPLGIHDVSFGIVSRPILRAFENFENSIEVHVLRPPTFASLETSLKEAKTAGCPFTVVHFDGHGSLNLPTEESTSEQPTGSVYFEKEGEIGFEPISAEQLASVLRDSGIQMVVFNACESARFVKQVPPEAVVATRLLREGVSAVIGMAYSVRAKTAATFMHVLYASLLKGDGIIKAVHEARIELANRVNDINTEYDWFVPVLYATNDAVLAEPSDERETPTNRSELRESLLGRDREFYVLERHFRTKPSILLHGMIGSGKTVLLDDFLAWLRTSRGLATGMKVTRHNFRVEDAQSIRQSLRSYRQTGDSSSILVLEDLDHLGQLGPSAGDIATELKAVLSTRNLKTVLTSRGPELWLGNIHRVYLGGLPERASVELLTRSFDSNLLEHSLRAFVESSFGNPRYLTRTARLLGEIQYGPDYCLWDGPKPENDHTSKILSLFPEVEHAVRIIPPAAKSVAYFLSLFDRFVDPMTLTFASLGSEFAATRTEQNEDAHEMFIAPPKRFVGIGPEIWELVLNRLEDSGLASKGRKGIRELHPVTSIALRAAWEEEAGTEFAQELTDATRCLTKVLATSSSVSQMIWDARSPFSGTADRRMLENALRTAVRESLFMDAFFIYRAAAKFRAAIGGADDVRELGEIVRSLIRQKCNGRPVPRDPARTLWTLTFENQNLFLSKEDNDLIRREVELIIREIDEGLPVENHERAFAFHMLGAIEGNNGRLDESESWYRKALEFADTNTTKYMSYRNLIVLALQRGDYDKAEANLADARQVFEGMEIVFSGSDLHSLEGIIALKRGLTSKAVDLQDQSLAELDQQSSLSQRAASMHEIGIAQAREGNLKVAEGYFKQAIKLKMTLQNKASLFTTFSALGELKIRTGELVEAEEWLREAQAILDESSLAPRSDMPLSSFVIRRAELLQNQHKYDEIRSLLEPVVQNAGTSGVTVLELNQARVLLALACMSTGHPSEVGQMLDAAISELQTLSLTSRSATSVRYCGMALSLRAGTHGNDDARVVDDALSGCEQLLASLELDKELQGSLDYYIGLSLWFALGRMERSNEIARARAVATLLSWFDHLRELGAGTRRPNRENDFFPKCVVSISRQLIECRDYQALAQVLRRGLDAIQDLRAWTDRCRALAETLYFISQEDNEVPSDFILALEPRRWAALADSYPSPDDISFMVFEFYVGVARQLCKDGNVPLIESLRDDLERRERENEDVRAGEAMAKLCIYLIGAYCLTRRLEDATRTLELLRLRTETRDVPGIALLSYAFSVRNVVVSLAREERLEEAKRITSQCIEITSRFGDIDSVTDLLLECAVEMAGVYATRSMFSQADEIVSQLESLRTSNSKIGNLNFSIANMLLQLFFSSLKAGRVTQALEYSKKLSSLASLDKDDYRIAGAAAIVCANAIGVHAATGHLAEALALLPRMFEMCLGSAFQQTPEIVGEMKKLLGDAIKNLKTQLDRNGDRAGLQKVDNLLNELSTEYDYNGS